MPALPAYRVNGHNHYYRRADGFIFAKIAQVDLIARRE
jgi:hypothetical protein